MNMKGFQRELEELVTRHGGQLTGPIEVILVGEPQQENHIHPQAEMRGLEKYQAVREVQPLNLSVSIRMNSVGPWKHRSNDRRRPYRDLHRNEED